MKKKKNRSLMIAISILLVLLLVYFVVRTFGKQTASQPVGESSRITLLDMTTDSITDITITKEDTSYHFIKEDNTWKNADDLEMVLSQSVLQKMEQIFSRTEVEREIAKKENQAEYGLSEPEYVVTATGEQGSQTLSIGMKNASTGDYYVYVDSLPGIYTISSEAAELFQYDLYDMVTPEAFPSIIVENITRFELEKDGESFVIEKLLEGSPYDPSNLQIWYVTETFEHEFPVSNVALEELYNAMTNLKFESTVNKNPSEMELESYGLKNSGFSYGFYYTSMETGLNGAQTEVPKYYKFVIGSKDELGNYYVKPEESSQVFTIAGSTIDALFAKTASDYVYRYFSVVNVRMVESVDVTMDGVTYTLEVKNTPTLNNGIETIESSYVYQGIALTEEKADWANNIYTALVSFTAEQVNMEAKATEELGEEIDFSVVYHRNEEPETFTITFTDYNTSYYLANVSGDAVYLVNKRDVESYKNGLIRAFESLDE